MTEARIQREKRHKSKQIKKILKERLNIDCLRMLGEEHPDTYVEANLVAEKSGSNQKMVQSSSQNLNDSYHVLMREIGAENNDGLS